jgi:hypothetical protein
MPPAMQARQAEPVPPTSRPFLLMCELPHIHAGRMSLKVCAGGRITRSRMRYSRRFDRASMIKKTSVIFGPMSATGFVQA